MNKEWIRDRKGSEEKTKKKRKPLESIPSWYLFFHSLFLLCFFDSLPGLWFVLLPPPSLLFYFLSSLLPPCPPSWFFSGKKENGIQPPSVSFPFIFFTPDDDSILNFYFCSHCSCARLWCLCFCFPFKRSLSKSSSSQLYPFCFHGLAVSVYFADVILSLSSWSFIQSPNDS